MRNGYCPTTVKTTAGPVTLQRPSHYRRGATVPTDRDWRVAGPGAGRSRPGVTPRRQMTPDRSAKATACARLRSLRRVVRW